MIVCLRLLTFGLRLSVCFLSLLSFGFYLLKGSGFGSFALLIFFLALLILSLATGSLFLCPTLCRFCLQASGFFSLALYLFFSGLQAGFLGFLLLFKCSKVSFFLSLAAGAFFLSLLQIFLGLPARGFSLPAFLFGLLSFGFSLLALGLRFLVSLDGLALGGLGFLTLILCRLSTRLFSPQAFIRLELLSGGFFLGFFTSFFELLSSSFFR